MMLMMGKVAEIKHQPVRSLSLNRFQLQSILFNAKIEVDLCNRGVGKSTLLGFKTKKVAHVMPKGTSVIVATTFKDAMDYTLPSQVAEWQKLGYYEDYHFVIGKRPPRDWEKPLYSPMSYEHFITWYTGHGFYIASQDKRNSFRGPSVDFVFGDEVASLNKEKFEVEILPTRRGNAKVFGDVELHHGIHLCGSKPLGSGGDWVYEFGNYYLIDGHDYDLIREHIVAVAMEMIDHPERVKSLWPEYVSLTDKIKYYVGPDGVLYLESFPFDNVENVKFRYFRDNRKIMSEYRFKVEMLNWRPRKIEKGFYPDFDIKKHTYDAVNYSHLEMIGYSHKNKLEPDCRFDSDRDEKSPLHIACDYGASHNCLWVNQTHTKETRWLNYFWTVHPGRIKDVVQRFCSYYKYHSNKTVHYYYDQTAIGGDGKSEFTYCDHVVQVLVENGFNVVRHYMGAAPYHFKKYELWGKALREEEDDLPKQTFNRTNCKQGIISIELTPSRQGGKGVEKDKRAESQTDYPQQDAPHGADAADQLLWGQCAHTSPKDFLDNIVV